MEVKEDIEENLRRHKGFIAIDFYELINFSGIN